MNRSKNITFVSAICMLLSGCSSTAIASVSSNAESADEAEIVKTIIVEADYSYYLKLYGDNCEIEMPNISSSENIDDNAVKQVRGSPTFEVGVTENVSDLYITIPKVRIIEKLNDEQTVSIKDGVIDNNEYLEIEKINIHETSTYLDADSEYPYEIVIEAKGKSASPYTIAFHTSEGENLGIGTFGYTIEEGLIPLSLIYRYPIQENDESLIENATLTFQRVYHFEYGTEAKFTSDDVELHIVDPVNS